MIQEAVQPYPGFELLYYTSIGAFMPGQGRAGKRSPWLPFAEAGCYKTAHTTGTLCGKPIRAVNTGLMKSV
jgi:hypothetical protein